VPYQTLRFDKTTQGYYSSYKMVITIVDSNAAQVDEKKFERRLTETEYYIAHGGTGKFDRVQTSFELPKGNFKVNVLLIDKLSKVENSKSRSITSLDFREFKFALSGIMLLSSIEENKGKYTITPFISDNIGNLNEGFLTFFETYNERGLDSVDFVYDVTDGKNSSVYQSNRIRKSVNGWRNQQFIKINQITSLTPGSYVLRITALIPSTKSIIETEDILAIAQRSIKYQHTVGGSIMLDLNKATKQLRYVATASEIDYIESGETAMEKQSRFDDFWKQRDPSPNTERNEAFEEYYSRIAIANKRFKSFSEGWLTDQGIVYIIFGEPRIERYTGYGNQKNYERWTYSSNREFIFADNTGFGDYRLIKPYAVTEKYKFGNN